MKTFKSDGVELLASVAKGVISFIQNIPSPQTRKEGVHIGLLNDVSAAETLQETHHYENITEKSDGSTVMYRPPMDGKIIVTPTIKMWRGTIQRKSTVNGYVDNSWPDVDNLPAD